MKNGVLGVMIVVISLMTTTFAGYLLNVNPTEELDVDYQYITDINGLFQHTGAPQFASYSPPQNITGYAANQYTISNPTGVKYITSSAQNKYSVLVKGAEEVQRTMYVNDMKNIREHSTDKLICVPTGSLNQPSGFQGWFGDSGVLHSQETQQGITTYYHYIDEYNYLTLQQVIEYIINRYYSQYTEDQIDRIEFTLNTSPTSENTKNKTLTPFLFKKSEDTETLQSVNQPSYPWDAYDRKNVSVYNVFDTATNGEVKIIYYMKSKATFLQRWLDPEVEGLQNSAEWRLMFFWNKQDANAVQTSVPIRVTGDGAIDFNMYNSSISISAWVNAEYEYVQASEGVTLNNSEGNYERQINEQTLYVEDPTDSTLYPSRTLTGTIGGEPFTITGNSYIYNIPSEASRVEVSISGPNIPEQGTQSPYVIAILDEGGNVMHISWFREERIWYVGTGRIHLFFTGNYTHGSDSGTIDTSYSPYNIQIRAYNTTQTTGYPGTHWTNTYENSKIGLVITTDWDNGQIVSNPPYFLMMEYYFNKNYTQDSWDDSRYLLRVEFSKDTNNNVTMRAGYWTNGRYDNTNEHIIVNNHYIGKWNSFYVNIDTVGKKLTVHSVSNFTNYLSYDCMEKPIYTVDLSSYTEFWDGAYPYVKGMGFFTNSKPMKWQISDTEVWLNDYGAVMVNPTLNVLDYFTDYEDYRVWIQSTAVYGSSMELNGTVYPVTNNSITLDTGKVDKEGNPIYQTHQLNNYYITVEDKKMYLTFVDGNKTYDLGVITDPTIKFMGMWFFKCSLYNGVEILVPVLNYTWNLAFDALQFVVISMGIGVLLFAYFYKTKNVKSFDILIVIFSIAIGIGYLIACGDMVV